MLMTLLGRECPELHAEVLFSDIEIKVLSAHAVKKNVDPPTQLGPAVRLVASLGGYLGRTRDPPPGHQIMCRPQQHGTGVGLPAHRTRYAPRKLDIPALKIVGWACFLCPPYRKATNRSILRPILVHFVDVWWKGYAYLQLLCDGFLLARSIDTG